MNRRAVLYGGVAAAAGLAGVGAAWWLSPSLPQSVPSAPVATKEGESDPFWGLSFDTPDGKSLAMSSFRGKLLLVNFWATWCPPCVEELPLLNAFYQDNKSKNLQILGLAVDQPSAVRKWLAAKPLDFAVGMAGLEGTELSKSLGNQAGSLPFSAVFAPSGELLHRKTGKLSAGDLASWMKSA
ncbi:MAG: TlpA disulfide reductase family protein [Polaromonas sp.]